LKKERGIVPRTQWTKTPEKRGKDEEQNHKKRQSQGDDWETLIGKRPRVRPGKKEKNVFLFSGEGRTRNLKEKKKV